MNPRIKIKRAYARAARGDGYRVLIDALWPRGLTKEAVAVDAWAKELAPSARLRRWFGHDPERWKGFVLRFRRELHAAPAQEALAALARRAKAGTVTIVYGARDEQHNNAQVVRAELGRILDHASRGSRLHATRTTLRATEPRQNQKTA
jgi:uncharacterized protein YeaO (DUF488 family)